MSEDNSLTVDENSVSGTATRPNNMAPQEQYPNMKDSTNSIQSYPDTSNITTLPDSNTANGAVNSENHVNAVTEGERRPDNGSHFIAADKVVVKEEWVNPPPHMLETLPATPAGKLI